jgi:hypothetical protein
MIISTRLVVLLASLLSLFGPDAHAPENLSREFWVSNGAIYNLPLISEDGKLLLFQTKYYVANRDLIKNHVSDSKGKSYSHVHFRHDFPDVEAANRYWDHRMDAPNMYVRVSNATIKYNGYACLWRTVPNSGVFECWTNNDMNRTKDEKSSVLPDPMTKLDQGLGMEDFPIKFGASPEYRARK